MVFSESDSAKMAEVVVVIRSLIHTRKNFCSLQELQQDFQWMEEEQIPYQRFGFRTLVEFLRNTRQFVLSRQTDGQVIVSTILSAKDQHIATLIKETFAKKNNKVPKRTPFPARCAPMRYPNANPTQRYQYPNAYPAQQRYQPNNQPIRRPPPIHQQRTGIQSCPQTGMWLRSPSTMSRLQPTTAPRPQPAPMPRPQPAPMPRPQPAPVLRQTPVPVQSQQPAPVAEFKWTPLPAEEMKRHPIGLNHYNTVSLQPQTEKPPVVQEKEEPKPIPVLQRDPVGQPIRTVSVPPSNGGATTRQLTVCVQTPQSTLRSASEFVRPPQRMTENRPPIAPFDGRRPHLNQYHKTAPSVLYYAPSFRENLQNTTLLPIQDRLRVRPNETLSRSPPDSGHITMGSDKGSTVSEKREYPVIREESHEVVLRLHELLLQYPGGMLERDLPREFQAATGMSLPDNWTSVVATYSPLLFSIEHSAASVIYANDPVESDGGEQEDEATEVLTGLPWTEPHWNVHITHMVSATMIWARLIGPNFSGRWDRLMGDMEAAMEDAASRKRVEQAEAKKMYLLSRDSSWHRVRCHEVDTEGRQLLAFFIDQGNEEWLNLDSLVECDEKFQRVAGQAVLFALFGMEAMEENPYAKPILERHLQNKSLVAEIVTKCEDHVEGASIQVVLYDTSSAEDVNLVDLLLTEICGAGRTPTLNASGLTEIKITHVSERGDVFCQVPGTGFEYVQKLVRAVVQKEETLGRHRGLKESLACGDSGPRYLVNDRENGVWYRAVLKVRHPQTAQHMMYCLDFGFQVTVAEKDIYLLDPLSVALSRFPAMAVQCRLFDIPTGMVVVDRIKTLLKLNSMAVARIMVSAADVGEIPRVNMHTRIESSQAYMCINETLRVEQAMGSLAN